MKLKSLLFSISLILISLTGYSQKLVGYVQSTTYATTPPAGYLSLSQLQYNKLTDVVFCFINPDNSGTGALRLDRGEASADFNFEMDKFQIVKSHCYPMVADGPRLWVAVGGASTPFPGARPARLNTICSAAGTRTTFCNNLANFANLHELQGIDIDWEFPTTAAEVANFNSFITQLRTSINAVNPKIKISVAVGGETSGGCPAVGTGTNHMGYFPAAAPAVVDYYNIMAYDLPSSYGPNHSGAAAGATAMTNWNSCRGIPFSKMCLGIPFYGKSDPRGTTINYNSLPAGAWTTDGPTSGVYYNGKPAIQAKIDYIRNNTYNGAGVVIWDIAQDKSLASGESLLSYANSKMFGTVNGPASATSTPCPPIPFLGKDTTICSGSTLTLNGGTASASPIRTFAWIKDGVAFGGTSNTQAVTAAGTYVAVVTQQYSPAGTIPTCTVRDTIVVDVQGDITAGPTSSTPYVCSSHSPSSASLSATGTGTLQWYTAATGGAPIGTGSPISVSPLATTTYYVQSASSPATKRYYGGRGYQDDATAMWAERTAGAVNTAYPEWVQRLTVYQPVTLKSVVVYFSSGTAHNPVTIKVYDAAGAGITLATVPTQVSANTTAAITVPARGPGAEPWGGYPVIVTVNITFQPGTYNIGVYNPNGSVAPQYANLQTAMSVPNTMPNIFSIGGNAYQLGAGPFYNVTTHYGQMVDWRFDSAPLGCTRKSITINYDCVAPVELVSFTGNNIGNKNYLSWSTSQEINNDYFNIERSSDGGNFEVIGTVNGSGNSSELKTYHFVDENPLLGTNYYRLAQYDFDGKVSYRALMVDNNHSSYQVSPNPFDNEIVIRGNGSGNTRTIQITTVQGTLVYQNQISNDTFSVGSDLTPGVYFLKIQDGNSSYTYKIVKK